MPVHRNTVKTILASSEQQILVIERRLHWATDAAERSKLIAKLANLHITQKNLKAILAGKDLPN
jgi:hypothetical protein